ncbi:hypothetical protein JYB55_15820 [Mycolicibacterium septicum]|nr:hypothetical protein [Mycolicibacterium septicum]
MISWKDAPNRTIDIDGATFAYRDLGGGSDIPVVFLHHLTAVLDDWDPRIIDGIAAQHRVIAFDNRGVGATGGSVPATVEQMGADDLSIITHPVLVANGDNDLMVDSGHSADMARRLPDAQLKIYPNSGHGGVFQHHQAFVADALQFLAN